MSEEVKTENPATAAKEKGKNTPLSKVARIALRREKISELMLAGYDDGGVRRITEYLNKIGIDCKKSTVANDIKFLLEESAKNSVENLELMRAMAFKQLESMRQAHWIEAQKKVNTGKFVRSLIDDQCELYGLKAAKKLEHSNPDGSGIMEPVAAAVNQFNQGLLKVYGDGSAADDKQS